MRRPAALALFALLLAQIPWLDCRCTEGCVRVAALLAPASSRAAPETGGPATCAHHHDHVSSHGPDAAFGHHAHGPSATGETPSPHDPSDHEHEIVIAVALAGAPAPAPSAPPVAALPAPPATPPDALAEATAAWRTLSSATGPPPTLVGTRLLL